MERRTLLGWTIASGAVGAARAQLRVAKPEEAGLSERRLNQAASLLEAETTSGRVLAASILVAKDERVVLHKGFGKIAPTAGSRAAGPDTVYLIASITKPLTACAMMMLVERGLVSIDDPVS
ncbi:MAG: serine hydrolase domain-containing protein, partial [Acidobacteriota bacterium]